MAAPPTVPQTAIRSSGRSHDKSLLSIAFLVALWLSLALAITFLMTLIVTTTIDGLGRFDSSLFTEYSSQLTPETTGLRAALLGTIWLMVTTALLAIPIGISAAVYLEEFADSTRWYNRLVELNLQNLAAVPSVIYGMLAVAVFALVGVDRTGIVLVGAVALGLLILPVIIITTREALRAVPGEIRDGSLALGATPLQTTWRQVLPSAVPGIATGTIIALSRAIGEAAPLLIIGVAVTVRFDPDGIMSSFTAMPLQIFNWTTESREEFKIAAAAGIIVLLGMVLALNGLAIFIRNKFQRRW